MCSWAGQYAYNLCETIADTGLLKREDRPFHSYEGIPTPIRERPPFSREKRSEPDPQSPFPQDWVMQPPLPHFYELTVRRVTGHFALPPPYPNILADLPHCPSLVPVWYLDAVKAWEQSVLTRMTTYSPISQPQLKAKIPLFLRNPKR